MLPSRASPFLAPPGGRARAVELRVVCPGAERVEAAGEMHDWIAPRALVRGDDGVFVGRFALPDGVYAYKLRIDGRWALDDGNPRRRSAGAWQNNLLAVGAAEEPLLFAPAPPFVFEEDRGGLVVTAGVRRGASATLSAIWSEDPHGRAHATPMQAVHEEPGHTLFRARLPASADRVCISFELEDGRRVGTAEGAPFRVERAATASTVPAWWPDAVVYAIFVDRFGPRLDTDAWGDDPGADVPAHGHLDAVTRSLDALADLGVTAIYLTPVHVAASCHRYDVIDPTRIDPALGGEEAFARLIEAAHARGLRVLVDFALGHAGRGFPPYEDVRVHGRASRFAPYFQWDEQGRLRHYGKRTDAPLLDLESPEVQAMAAEALEAWAARGIDGIRIDAAAQVPFALARAVRTRLRELRPDAVVLGEVVPEHAWRWRAEGAVDAATDFTFHRVSNELLVRRTMDAPGAVQALRASELARGGPASTALRFVSTHDHARSATLARAERRPQGAWLGLVHLLTSPGVPMLLYGEELGLAADVAHLEPEGAWPDRMPMRWRTQPGDEEVRALVKRLLALRRRHRALRDGEADVLFAQDRVLLLRRAADGETVDVAINAGDEGVELEVADDQRPGLEVLCAVGAASVRGQTIALGPGAAVVARRSPGARGGGLRVAQGRHPARRDEAFARGDVATVPSPTRIDFAVTEACNLRCAHCITAAPVRTRTGSARTLTPWLLDRLRDALAFAEYVGFVHGGEPLVAPILHDVLGALRAARGGSPTVVHVLTNGMLLDARMTARLVDEGVRSISVSLDGATAATNDRVRVGGDFHRICRNVRAAAQLRDEARVDLRLGISLVVLGSNVSELSAAVDLAASLGVDWMKLEEAVPVNRFATRAAVAPDHARTRDAVERAAERARTLGITLVDHTAPPAVWLCKLAGDPAMRAFLRADEYANRSTIHPCRAPWERACIDPDGGVRIGDFFGPRLGSVADAPLAELWNGPVARSERMASQRRRPCGPTTPECGASRR